MGYNTYTMHEGYNIYTPTFESVTATNKKLSIQDLKLINSEGWGTETIWVMNENGTAVTGETYNWQNTDMSGLDEDGWIDDTGALADVEITEGDGFYLLCDGTDGIQVQVAGSVKFGKFTHTMHEGYNLTGNFCPKTINIQGIKLTNTEGWGTETIWVMNENGTAVTGETYNWQNTDMSGLDKDGWIDDTGALADVGYKSGEGVYLLCDGTDGVVIEIDPVLIKE